MISKFPPAAKVWIYQAGEPFRESDIPAIEEELQHFARQWVCHNEQLSSGGALLHNRFVILAVDESSLSASGCSIDSSVAFIKQLGAQYNRDLLDRMRFSYIDEAGNVQTVSRDDFTALYANGEINDQTIVFDPLVKTLGEMEKSFEKNLINSWHSQFV